MQIELSKDTLITQPLGYFAAGQTTRTGTVLDMEGYDGCLFVLMLSAVSDSAVTTLTINENTANSTSSPTPVAVTNGAATHTDAGAGADSNGLLIVDVIRPKDRYIYPVVTISVANVVIEGILAIRYRVRTVPVTPDASVLQSVLSTPEV